MLFDIEDLTHEYSDGTLALDHVSVGFKRSERIALLGTNGSGKTTLLNHLNGILNPPQAASYLTETQSNTMPNPS